MPLLYVNDDYLPDVLVSIVRSVINCRYNPWATKWCGMCGGSKPAEVREVIHVEYLPDWNALGVLCVLDALRVVYTPSWPFADNDLEGVSSNETWEGTRYRP